MMYVNRPDLRDFNKEFKKFKKFKKLQDISQSSEEAFK